MMPAMAMVASSIRITMAVAGRTGDDRMSVLNLNTLMTVESMSRPPKGGLDYMKGDSVTVGRAGRLSVHTLSERALGMRETECPPSCMHCAYRPRRVVP